MNKILTIAEIQSQFDGEWVLVAEPQTKEALEVQSSQVLYHSKNREEFDRKGLEFHSKRFAVLFTGQPQENMEYVL